MKAYSFESLVSYLDETHQEVKVSSLRSHGFNILEGHNITFNAHILPNNRYAGHMVQVQTNSTYLDDVEDVTDDGLSRYLSSL